MNARTASHLTARLFATALVALLVVSCEHAPTATGVLASIAVERDPDTLAVLSSRQMHVIGRDANGSLVGVSPVWTVVAGGGSIDANGLFTAGATVGTYTSTVKATVGSISGVGTIVVTPGLGASVAITPSPVPVVPEALASIVVTPNPRLLAIGEIQTFTAGTVVDTFTNTVRACSTPLCAAGANSGVATVVVNAAGALAGNAATPPPR